MSLLNSSWLGPTLAIVLVVGIILLAIREITITEFTLDIIEFDSVSFHLLPSEGALLLNWSIWTVRGWHEWFKQYKDEHGLTPICQG